MIFQREYTVGIEDIGMDRKMSNKAVLSCMEDIASLHSAQAGYGVLDAEIKRKGWILLDWQIQVLRRPQYNETLQVSTWSRGMDKVRAYRDFTIKSQTGELAVIGTSCWILLDIDKRRPQRLTEEIAKVYGTETDRRVFDREIENIELELPLSGKTVCTPYKVQRRDIDINYHVHNINYLEIALEALPEERYQKAQYDEIRIQYKREIRYGDAVECHYIVRNGYDTVVMLVQGGLRAIVAMK